ncbi:MAG: MFS transporter [Actinomycetota bacterium]|nr:MFS transporter [Actinomycetota bacterium]
MLLLSMLAVGVAQGFGRFSYALVLPALNRDVLHSYALAGLLATANVAAYLAGTALVSLASTRYDAATLMRGGIAASAGGLVVLAVAPGIPVLAAGMVLTGLGGAFVWVPAPGLAGSVVAPARRGSAVGVAGAGIGVGVVFASQLAGVVHHVFGQQAWREVWAVEAAIAVVVLIAVLRWLNPPTTERTGGHVRVSVLREVPGWAGLLLGYATYGLSMAIFMNYVVAALEGDSGFSLTHASTIFAVVGLVLVPAGVLLGRLSDRVGRRPTLVLGYLLMSAGALLVPLGAEPAATVAAVVFALAMGGLPTVIAAHVGEHLSTQAFGAAFGTLTLFFGVAQVVGPQLGGALAERTGSFALSFVVSAAVAALGAACSLLVPGRTDPGRRPGRVKRAVGDAER